MIKVGKVPTLLGKILSILLILGGFTYLLLTSLGLTVIAAGELPPAIVGLILTLAALGMLSYFAYRLIRRPKHVQKKF